MCLIFANKKIVYLASLSMSFISLWPDLNSIAQSEMKTSQLTGREKESERERANKSIVRLASLFTCLI